MNKFGFAAVVASGLTAAILGLAAPAQAATAVKTPASWPRRSTSRPTSATTRGSLTSSRMPTSRSGNHTPTPRGTPMRVSLFRWQYRLHRWTSHSRTAVV